MAKTFDALAPKEAQRVRPPFVRLQEDMTELRERAGAAADQGVALTEKLLGPVLQIRSGSAPIEAPVIKAEEGEIGQLVVAVGTARRDIDRLHQALNRLSEAMDL